MYVMCTDESILVGPDPKQNNQFINYIKDAKLNITNEGDIQDFLGVKIYCKPDGTIHLTQPHLIDQILDDLKMGDKKNLEETPAPNSKIMSRHANSEGFSKSFKY